MLESFTFRISAFTAYSYFKYILLRFYPIITGLFVSFLPFRLPFVFVRSDCNHFGSWLFVFIANIYFRDILYSNKKLIIFAKKGTILPYWIDYLYYSDVKVVYNPLYQFLYLHSFFKIFIDVNGHLLSSLPV